MTGSRRGAHAGAFAETPEPPRGVDEPLQFLSDCNQLLLRHCANLRRLVLYVAECGCDAQAQSVIAELSRFFGELLPQQHADEALDLFPALMESMAGSDPVCLRDTAHGLAQAHREIRTQWLWLRPALEGAAAGRPGSLPAHEVESFVECCKACVAREEEDLLPMAARLLSDDQLRDIAASMRRRRAPAA